MDYVVNLETNRGEGLVFIEFFDDEYPLYERAYIPFVDDDSWALDLLQKSDVVRGFKDFFYTREGNRIVSVMVAKVFEMAPEYIDMEIQRATDIARLNNVQARIVMQDGESKPIAPGFDKERINLWVAKGHVYRAEYF